jgi:hypothetical protein
MTPGELTSAFSGRIIEGISPGGLLDEKTREELLDKMPNCWEFNSCPDNFCDSCPAYPDHGKECWKLTGTKCARGQYETTSLAEKIIYCRNECAFYKKYLKLIYR